MLSHEFTSLKPFKAVVRLQRDRSQVATLIWSDSASSARRNLGELYGAQNVLSVSQIPISETAQSSPQDQQIKSLKAQAKQVTQQAKLAKARQQVTKAQAQLRKTTASQAAGGLS